VNVNFGDAVFKDMHHAREKERGREGEGRERGGRERERERESLFGVQ